MRSFCATAAPYGETEEITHQYFDGSRLIQQHPSLGLAEITRQVARDGRIRC